MGSYIEQYAGDLHEAVGPGVQDVTVAGYRHSEIGKDGDAVTAFTVRVPERLGPVGGPGPRRRSVMASPAVPRTVPDASSIATWTGGVMIRSDIVREG
jgi:hypothetical protein